MGDSSEWIEAVVRRLGSTVGHCVLSAPSHEYTELFASLCTGYNLVISEYVLDVYTRPWYKCVDLESSYAYCGTSLLWNNGRCPD